MDPYYLFKLPAFALIVGLLLIDTFISRTNAKIAADKAKKAAAEAAEKSRLAIEKLAEEEEEQRAAKMRPAGTRVLEESERIATLEKL